MLCRANAKLDIKTGHVADVEVYCQDGEGSGGRGNPQTTLFPLGQLSCLAFVKNSLPPAEDTKSQRPLNLLCDQKIS